MKKLIQALVNRLGYHITRISRVSRAPINPLLHHKIELLFDVGANIGQYAMGTRMEGYKGGIVSFEPLPDAYEELLENSQNDSLWIIHRRCAVGSNLGETDINISQNSYSSSLLPILQACSSAAPDSIYIGKAKTDVITLDSVFESYRKNN